jgi:hypothetical protein
VARGRRRRREGTRWLADIHATPQAYHAAPDAVIHPSAWKGNSPKLASKAGTGISCDHTPLFPLCLVCELIG